MDIQGYFENRRQFIEEKLKEFLNILYEGDILGVTQNIVGGGKRVRGVLTILTCEALGGAKSDALDYAIAAELMHAASLAHDDIIDGDTLRRGGPTAWITFGLKKAVLIPHLLISHALLLIRKHGVNGLEIVLKSWVEATKGQIKDTFKAKTFDKKFYSFVATAKTSTLFSVATTLGTLAAKKPQYTEITEQYGRKIGLAFQVADDIVDLAKLLEGDETIKDRNPSLPAFISYISDGEVTDFQDVNKDILEDSLSKLKQLLQETGNLTEKLPNSEYKQILKEFPAYIITLMLREANLSI